MTQADLRRRQFFPASDLRIERLRKGRTLADIAVASGIPATRLSFIERYPELATGTEIERLREVIHRAEETRP